MEIWRLVQMDPETNKKLHNIIKLQKETKKSEKQK